MKNQIRKQNKMRRSEMTKDEVLVKSRAAAEIFLACEIYEQAEMLMLYMPLGNETDPLEIMNRAFDDGKKLAFPVTDERRGEITPFEVFKETEFVKGAFSVREPRDAKKVDISKIDVVLVPGIAFDVRGARIGFGKGCYDRLLKNTAAVKVGLCYQFQICDEIEAEEHDIKMDYLVTENSVIKCK